MHLIDYVLIAVIAALLVLAIVYIHRSGKGCSGCASCPYAGSCKKSRAKPKRIKK